ncbi:MAG: hypothetical protein ACLFUS_12740 [Candidatus Sumerlaeia bacterium]
MMALVALSCFSWAVLLKKADGWFGVGFSIAIARAIGVGRKGFASFILKEERDRDEKSTEFLPAGFYGACSVLCGCGFALWRIIDLGAE